MMDNATIFVSTVVVKDGKLLVVQEGKNNYGQLDTWNFPAGHVEPGESLIGAAVREAKEESGYTVAIDGVLSVLLKNTDSGMSLIVFFLGYIADDLPAVPEEGIQRIDFVSLEDLEKLDLRFPDDMLEPARRALAGESYPPDIIMDYQKV